MSVRVCAQNFAVVRRGVSEEIGHRKNKQTLKYLVDNEWRWRTKLRFRPMIRHLSAVDNLAFRHDDLHFVIESVIPVASLRQVPVARQGAVRLVVIGQRPASELISSDVSAGRTDRKRKKRLMPPRIWCRHVRIIAELLWTAGHSFNYTEQLVGEEPIMFRTACYNRSACYASSMNLIFIRTPVVNFARL